MSVVPHARVSTHLRVRVEGAVHVLDGPRASLGRLGFMRSDDTWHLIDEGLTGGMFRDGERLWHLSLLAGEEVALRIGSPGGPEVVVDADPPAEPVEPTRATSHPAFPVLVAKRLSVSSRSGHDLVRNVDLAVEKATLTALIGPSGAGKSTLLRALAGQAPLSRGGVWWQGRDVHVHRSELSTQIGFVPQEQIQHPQLGVRQSLRFSARLRLPDGTSRREIHVRVDQVIDRVGLVRQRRHRIGTQLSGGQQKRVSIATELLTSPPLLFLDEPTSGLDPGRDRSVMEHLRELADDGRVVVVATHSVQGLDRCDQVVVMARGGRVVHVGPPEGVLDHFGCDDYPQLFDLLETGRNLPSTELTPAAVSKGGHRRVPAPSSPGAQFVTLVRRNLAVLLADRMHLAMLVLMPLLLAMLGRVVQGDHGLSLAGAPSSTEASQRLTILIIAAALMGTAMSIRDLVQERSIYRRERAVGLSPSAYFASKAAVLGMACFLQGVLVTKLSLVGLPGPDGGGVVNGGWWEIAVPVGLLSCVMALAGLCVSALVRSSDQTAPALVAVVMSQVVLSGAIVRLSGRPVLEQLSWLAPGRWAHAAMAASVDLDRGRRTADVLYAHEARMWLVNLAALVLTGVVIARLGRAAVGRITPHD